MTDTLKAKTAKGLMWGAINNGTMQVLNLAFGIVLARQLSPRDYGIVGVLAIFTTIASNLQNAGFSSALINLKQATAKDYNAVFWFSVTVSVVLYVLLFLSAPLIAWFFHEPELVKLSRFVFLAFVAGSLATAHAGYMSRHLMVREVAITGFIALGLSGTIGVILACTGYGYWALACQNVVFMLLGSVCRYIFIWRQWHPTFHFDPAPLRSMFGFGSKMLITNIVNNVSNNVLTVIFGNLYPMKAVGQYTQAMKWNNTANGTIGGMVNAVAQPVLASVTDEPGRERRVFRKMMRFTAFLSFPAMFGLALVSNEFILITIGEKWAESAILLQILCISGAFIPLHTLFQNLAIGNGRSDVYMWCTIAQIAIQIGIILAFHSYGIRTMVTVYAAFLIVWLAVWQAIARRLAGIRLNDTLLDTLPFLLAAAATMAVTYIATAWITDIYLLLATRIIIAAAVYFIIMKAANAKILNECLAFLLHRGKQTGVTPSKKGRQ